MLRHTGQRGILTSTPEDKHIFVSKMVALEGKKGLKSASYFQEFKVEEVLFHLSKDK